MIQLANPIVPEIGRFVKKPRNVFIVEGRSATPAALTEEQVMEVITRAIGSEPSHRDKAARFMEWRLTDKSVLRAELSADVILIRESPQRLGGPRRTNPSARIVIQLSDEQAEKQIIAAVQSIHRRIHESQIVATIPITRRRSRIAE